jgi:hypothetical protein
MLAALLLSADLAGSLSVSDRTELRVWAPGTPPASASLDAETELTARLTLARRRFRSIFAYTPRLTLWDAESSARSPTLLHGGEARVEWPGRRALLSLDETGSYGGVSFASYPLSPGPDGQPPRVEPLPAPRIIQFVSSTTTLASLVTLRRWTVDTSAGYQLSGGADTGAQAVLPFQAGPFGEARADYAASRPDHAITKLSVSEAAFSSGPESLLVEVDAGYRRLWSRLDEARLTLGATEARARASAIAADTYTTYPVVEAALERKRDAGGHLAVSIGARLGPMVNRLDGTVEQWVQGTLAASHSRRRLTTRLFTSAGETVNARSANAMSLFAGELGAAYAATGAVTLDAGVRGFWQRLETTRVPFVQGTVFIGVSLRAPTQRF